MCSWKVLLALHYLKRLQQNHPFGYGCPEEYPEIRFVDLIRVESSTRRLGRYRQGQKVSSCRENLRKLAILMISSFRVWPDESMAGCVFRLNHVQVVWYDRTGSTSWLQADVIENQQRDVFFTRVSSSIFSSSKASTSYAMHILLAYLFPGQHFFWSWLTCTLQHLTPCYRSLRIWFKEALRIYLPGLEVYVQRILIWLTKSTGQLRLVLASLHSVN